jgi:hypothetical protein
LDCRATLFVNDATSFEIHEALEEFEFIGFLTDSFLDVLNEVTVCQKELL